MSNGTFGQGERTLSTAAGMVREAKGDFNRIADKLTNQIQGVQGRWGGEGAKAFFILNQAWNEKQKVIVSALDEFAESLGVTEQTNTSTDQDQGARYTKMQNRL